MTPTDPALPIDVLRVAPWPDPVLEVTGHDPRSSYVERFWLALLGPSTTWFLRRTAAELDGAPDGFDLNLQDWARSLGLGTRGGRNAPFLRAIARTSQFRLSTPGGDHLLLLRRKLPNLSHHQALRLPPPLRDEHEAWHQAAHREPDLAQRRTRARRLALSLLELGEGAEAIEQQLHRWKVHPAMAHEALRWAQLRRGGVSPAEDGASPDPESATEAGSSARSLRPIPPPPPIRHPAAASAAGPQVTEAGPWRPPVPTGPPPGRITPKDAA